MLTLIIVLTIVVALLAAAVWYRKRQADDGADLEPRGPHRGDQGPSR